MWKIQLILLTICLIYITRSVAIRTCSDPRRYYNQYINHPKADRCPDGSTAQCVAALFHLCGAPNTNLWKRGINVNANCNKIPRNTAIASFSASGGTNLNGPASVFLYCLPGGDIRVANQWCGHKFNERTLFRLSTNGNRPFNCADSYYTIEW